MLCSPGTSEVLCIGSYVNQNNTPYSCVMCNPLSDNPQSGRSKSAHSSATDEFGI